MSDETPEVAPERSLEQVLTGLTPKQLEYLEALPQNNWQAYKTIKKLGSSSHTLWKWMQDADFALARQLLMKRFVDGIGASYERTVSEIARIAHADIRNVIGPDGRPLPPSEWDDETAAAIQSVEIETRFEGKGEDREMYYVTKFKTHSKMDALKTHLAIHGKLVERHEHTGKDGAPLGMPVFQIVRYEDDPGPAASG